MRSQVVGTFLLVLALGTTLGQSPTESKPTPVEAEFLSNLRVRQLAPGAKILTKVTVDWHGPDCTLKAGSILEATVEIAERHNDRIPSRVALSFTKAQCNGPDLKPMKLSLVAIAKPPDNWDGLPDSVFKGPVVISNPNGTKGIVANQVRGTSLSHLELNGITHRFPSTSNIHPGAVLDISGLKLEVGTGPNRSSVLNAKNHDVYLDMFTQILLLPDTVVFRPGATVRILSDPTAKIDTTSSNLSAPSTPVPANDIDVCAPPGCSVDLPVTAKELEGHKASSIDIHALGYAPRHRKVPGDISNEETIAWLSPRQLLFAFTKSRIIGRHDGSKKEPRVVQERKRQHGLAHSIHATAHAVFGLAKSGNTAVGQFLTFDVAP